MTKLIILCLCSLLACGVQAQRITTIQLDGVQYFISRMNPYSPELNYFLAYQYCRSLGLQLASFETKEKVESMTQYLQNAGYSKYDFWTSGNRLGTGMFLWMSTGLPFNATFDFFENSIDAVQAGLLDPTDHNSNTAPQRTARDSNSGLEKGCVMLKAPSLKWMPEDCSTVKDFICEQTRCYYYNYGSIPVSSAQGRPIISSTLRGSSFSTTPLPSILSSTIATFKKKLINDHQQQQQQENYSSSDAPSSLSSPPRTSLKIPVDNDASLLLKLTRPSNNNNGKDNTNINNSPIIKSTVSENNDNNDHHMDVTLKIHEDIVNDDNVEHNENEEARNLSDNNEHDVNDYDDNSKDNDYEQNHQNSKESLDTFELTNNNNNNNDNNGNDDDFQNSSELPSVEQRLKKISQEIEKLGGIDTTHTNMNNNDADIGHKSFLSLSDLIKTLRPNEKKIPQIDSDYSNTMRVLGEKSLLIANNNNNNDELRKFRDTETTVNINRSFS